MKTKHTPGPWEVSNEDTIIGPQGNVVAECCGYSVKATDATLRKQGGREANAHFIVRACNNFDDMLALLEDISRWFDHHLTKGTINAGTANRDGDLVSQIRAAIAKAKGGE